MTEFKKGDTVFFDEKEHTYVQFDEENNLHIIEDSEGEEFGVDLQEVTAAAKTIEAKPSVAQSPSKSQMMSAVIQRINTMPASDAVDFFNKVMAGYGAGKDHGVGNPADKNEDSIEAKPSHASGDTGNISKHAAIFDDVNVDEETSKAIREEIAEIFGSEDLTEEFKEKVTTLFESAVNLKVTEKVASIKEELDAKFEETMKEAVESMEENIDKYLSYVAEEWVEENKLEIDYGIKEEMTESFIFGLKKLFSEHYWEVPEDKVDAFDELTETVAELKKELDEVKSENIELADLLAKVNAEEIFKEVSEGLAVTQKDKFKVLAENLEFDGDEDVYRKNLETIKEHFFKSGKKTTQESTLFEEVELDEESEDKNGKKGPDPIVNRYAAAIGRTIKK